MCAFPTIPTVSHRLTGATIRFPEPKRSGKSSRQGGWRFRYVLGLLLLRRVAGSSTLHVSDLHDREHSRGNGDVAGACSVSRNADDILERIGRKPTFGIFPPVLQNQSNSVGKVLLALFNALALAVSSGNLRAVTDVPLLIAFDYGGELVMQNVLPSSCSLCAK